MAIPSSGELELYGDIGTELGVAQSNVSLHGMSQTAGFTEPDAMSEFYGYSPLPSDYIAWYKLDGNANDSSSNNYNGLASNVSYVSGRFGQAGSFNGTSSSIRTISPTVLNSLGENYSLVGWFKVKSSKFNPIFFSVSSLNTGYFTLFVAVNSNNSVSFGIYSEFPSGTENIITTAPNYITNNTYYNVVATSSSTTINLYINGVSAGSLTKTISKGTSSDLYLGSTTGFTFPDYANVDIDQVRIYPRAITQSEVTELFNEPTY